MTKPPAIRISDFIEFSQIYPDYNYNTLLRSPWILKAPAGLLGSTNYSEDCRIYNSKLFNCYEFIWGSVSLVTHGKMKNSLVIF